MYKNLLIVAAGCGICMALFAVSFTGSTRRRADFVWNNGTEPQTLDPGIMSGQPEGEIAIGLFEGLTHYHPRTLAPMPGVARDWEITGLTYTFYLRADAWWVRGDRIFEVDGRRRRVVAQDFVYAWRRHLLPETGSEYSYLLHLIEGASEFEDTVARHWKQLVERYRDEHPEVVLVNPASLLDGSLDASLREICRRDHDELQAFRDHEWGRLVKVVAPSENRLEVTLKSPAPYFLDLTSFYPLAAVPREPIEAHGRSWILPENIVTNGPYLLDDWRFNAYVRLRKNRHYWENARYAMHRIQDLEGRPDGALGASERAELDYLRQSGPFTVNGLEILDALAVEEQNTALNLYINGDVDRVRDLPTSLVGDLIRESRRGTIAGSNVHHGVYNACYFYNLNMELAVFSAGENGELGRKLRRALSLSINRRELIDLITRAHQQPAYRIVPSGIPGYTDRPAFGSGDHSRDVAEARRLLEEVRSAGVQIPRLKILYNTHENHAKIGVYIQNLWKTELGIDVDLANQEWGVFLDSRRSGNYEIARSGWIGDYADPNTFLDMFTEGNQNNDPRYRNPHYDRIVLKYCGYILDHLATREAREAMLADLRSWPNYDRVIRGRLRSDGRNLDEILAAALETYDTSSSSQRLDLAFDIRLRLFEIAEEMLCWDMPIIPLYFYTTTQLWPPELKGVHINSRDTHPKKTLRWQGGRRPGGSRYDVFPTFPTRLPSERDLAPE